MSTETTVEPEFRCIHCQKLFRRESSLIVHLCEPKRRSQEKHEVGVQLGLQSWLRFFEITQGSSKLKSFDDFVKSPYYRAFVKFGRYAQDIRAVNFSQFVDWLIRQNKKLDHWCQDRVYSEYLLGYVKTENSTDALLRAMEEALRWQQETDNPSNHYLRYGNVNRICHSIVNGRVTAWCLFNCDSGNEFLQNLNAEQLAIIYDWVDADFWDRKFRDYSADQAYARDILSKAGW